MANPENTEPKPVPLDVPPAMSEEEYEQDEGPSLPFMDEEDDDGGYAECDDAIELREYGTLKLYRDDSVTPVVYENVKHVFMTANNTILTIAQITDLITGDHRYLNWPRERWCWYSYDKPPHSS